MITKVKAWAGRCNQTVASFALLTFMALAVSMSPAHATDPVAFIDTSGLVTGASDSVKASLVAALPGIAILMFGLVAVGIVFKWLKKGAKSS